MAEKSKGVSFDENSLLVIENTGVYHRMVWEYCNTRDYRCILAMQPILNGALALPEAK